MAYFSMMLQLMAQRMRRSTPWMFAQELLDKPRAVGAVWPSSQALARRMASQVPVDGRGWVVELGGGTGAITEAILARGVSPERLLVVERSGAFVRHLRRRFPAVRVLQGDAAKLAQLLPPGACVDAIVSSLPLRSLPAPEAGEILAQWVRVCATGGVVIQFTYDLPGLRRHQPPGFAPCASSIVWNNLPPARVLTFARSQARAGR